MNELAAYLDWPVTFKEGAIFCENGNACPNPSCDGNGTARIRMVYLLDPRELLGWIKKHAEDPGWCLRRTPGGHRNWPRT